MVDAGMKLVLMPGMDGTGALFRGFVAALPAGFEVEVVRYPAEAGSSFEELLPLVLAALPLDAPYVVVAESFSTPLAIRVAGMRPAGLQGLVLCSGFATTPVRGWLYTLTTMLPLKAIDVGLMGALWGHHWFSEVIARLLLVGADAPKDLVTEVGAEISWVEPKVLAARVRAVLACDMRKDLAAVVVPIQYLRAGEDRLVSVECLEEILRVQPATAVTAIDGPHMLLQREPKLMAEIVAGFVRGLVVGGLTTGLVA
jgi:pimeloyl-ACP methyl ester carboxylesterase